MWSTKTATIDGDPRAVVCQVAPECVTIFVDGTSVTRAGFDSRCITSSRRPKGLFGESRAASGPIAVGSGCSPIGY
jgi:hypothetical protein